MGLSAPPLIPAKDPPLPGPGHYDIVKYSGPVKQPVSTAAFLSGTHRGIQESTEEVPGPGNKCVTVLFFHVIVRNTHNCLNNVYISASQVTMNPRSFQRCRSCTIRIKTGYRLKVRDVLESKIKNVLRLKCVSFTFTRDKHNRII